MTPLLTFLLSVLVIFVSIIPLTLWYPLTNLELGWGLQLCQGTVVVLGLPGERGPAIVFGSGGALTPCRTCCLPGQCKQALPSQLTWLVRPVCMSSSLLWMLFSVPPRSALSTSVVVQVLGLPSTWPCWLGFVTGMGGLCELSVSYLGSGRRGYGG